MLSKYASTSNTAAGFALKAGYRSQTGVSNGNTREYFNNIRKRFL